MKKLNFISLLVLCSFSSNLHAMKAFLPKSNDPTEKCLHLKEDREKATYCLSKYAVRRIKNYKKEFNTPLEQRVYFASQDLVDFLTADNKLSSYPERSFIPKADLKGDIAIVKKVMAGLHPKVKKLVDKYFAGVFLMENFGGTGYSAALFNKENKIEKSLIVLDPRKLQKTANGWNSWKESTPFKKGSYHIEALIEEDSQNTKENAIRYILLHELGHVLNIALKDLPPWSRGMTFQDHPSEFKFAKLSWVGAGTTYITRENFKNRKNVVYYWGAKLANNEMVNIYKNLEQSEFPTLYAVTNVWDDYAESFVNYVHVVLEKRKWAVHIKQGEKIVKTIKHCWNQKRCQKKKVYFDNLFK